MIWLYVGAAYMAAYVVVAWLIADAALARLWFGNIGLLLPPLAPMFVILRRRRQWRGHHRVFWDALAVAAAAWLAAQIPWAIYELRQRQPFPWLDLIIIPQLCASLMPALALVARPHRGQRPGTAMTAVLDLYVLALLWAFVCWSLIVLPGMSPAYSETGLKILAIVGPSVRVAVFVSLGLAAWRVGPDGWARSYVRIGAGAFASFAILSVLFSSVMAGNYRTGSPLDLGFMAPFWFWAWAAAMAPESGPEPYRSLVDASRPSPPTLLFVALCAVPVIGFGGHYLLPLSEDLERYRVLMTSMTMVFGLAMAMVRNGVERRALRYADRQIRLLAAACEQSDESIVIVRGGAIRYANPAFTHATGYAHDELRTLTLERLAPEGTRELAARLDAAETRREMARFTTEMCRKGGTKFQADCTLAPTVDPAQSGSYVVCVIRDLTEQLRLQEQLVHFERMSAIGELLSGVALELSSPMQSVVGTLEVLRQSDRTTELQEDIARASREADRAVRIVKNLLAFVKRAPSERMLTDFNEIVQSAIAVRSAALGASRIEVQTEYAGGLPLVQINRDELRQAIVNLIINAEQSMISAHGVGTLVIRTWLNGADAVVDVCDDGPGVPAEVAGRIFEPFFSARRASGGGVGLGLSAAFGIVVAHGGRLELMPAANGACFRLALPGAGFAGPMHAQPAGGVRV